MSSQDPPHGRSDLDIDSLERLFRDGRVNAMLAWVLVAIICFALTESVLDADWIWVAFIAASGGVVLLPPIATREWRVMLPWELLAIALFPILVRGLVGGTVGTIGMYLSIAALALLVTVELHMFTTLELTQWFAVAFVVLATMATVALLTILRWNADRYLGTSYLIDNYTLMQEWLAVTISGLLAGVLFDSYFKRRDRQLRRAIRRLVVR